MCVDSKENHDYGSIWDMSLALLGLFLRNKANCTFRVNKFKTFNHGSRPVQSERVDEMPGY